METYNRPLMECPKCGSTTSATGFNMQFQAWTCVCCGCGAQLAAQSFGEFDTLTVICIEYPVNVVAETWRDRPSML